MDGLLRLRFDHDGNTGRTVLAACEQRPPLRVVRAFPTNDGGALVHLHNVSGGILGGDQLTLAIQVGAGAIAQLTTTGATRLYRSGRGLPVALQVSEITIEEDGLLEYLPDPVIPYAGSQYRQESRIKLARGGGLFWWETIAPGREAHGELFEYELLQLNLDIVADGRPIALERVRNEPAVRSLSSSARLGPFRYFSTFYICRVGFEKERWLLLERQLSELARRLTQPAGVIWGVSSLPENGLIVRALSIHSRALAAGLAEFWSGAKRELYGRDAVAPRKVP